MKKIVISFVLILTLAGFIIFGILNQKNNTNAEYLRIHIRANSNAEIDQNIKYKVKDAVVESMIPILSTCKTKQDAEVAISNNFMLIESVANNILSNNGFTYTAKAYLANEEFPSRQYDSLVLDAGFYDALILELGDGTGNNWWCVAYPPLCFLKENATGESVVYKSKLVEIIKSFFD